MLFTSCLTRPLGGVTSHLRTACLSYVTLWSLNFGLYCIRCLSFAFVLLVSKTVFVFGSCLCLFLCLCSCSCSCSCSRLCSILCLVRVFVVFVRSQCRRNLTKETNVTNYLLVTFSTCLAQVRFSSTQTPRHLVYLTPFKEMPFTDKLGSPSSAAIDEQLFIDSLHVFGRALFLAVVTGLALQGCTKRIFYRTTYTGRRYDSTRKKWQFCIRCSSISVLISHNLNLFGFCWFNWRFSELQFKTSTLKKGRSGYTPTCYHRDRGATLRLGGGHD